MSQCSNPLALIAEITHRCPLHCVYCSNPLELTSRKEELATADWLRVFGEAAALGVLHLHLTGGEPLARTDLAELIDGARQSRLYTNLITSGIGLSRERLAQLVEAGLDHIQLSFQDSSEGPANWIAGARAHAHKIELAGWIRESQIGERQIAFGELPVRDPLADQIPGETTALLDEGPYRGPNLRGRSAQYPFIQSLCGFGLQSKGHYLNGKGISPRSRPIRGQFGPMAGGRTETLRSLAPFHSGNFTEREGRKVVSQTSRQRRDPGEGEGERSLCHCRRTFL